jgi:hypothetical protein
VLLADDTYGGKEFVFDGKAGADVERGAFRRLNVEAIAGVELAMSFGGGEFKMLRSPDEMNASSMVLPSGRGNDDAIEQSVELEFTDPPRPILPVLHGAGPQISISTAEVAERLPIALQIPRGVTALSERERELLRGIRPSYLDFELRNAEETMSVESRAAGDMARSVGASVRFRVGEASEEAVVRLLDAAEDAELKVAAWMLDRDGDTSAIEAMIRDHSAGGASAVIAARGTEKEGDAAYPLRSIAVAASDESLIEGLEALESGFKRHTGRSGKPQVIREVRMSADRSASMFGAAWLIGCLHTVAMSGGVHSMGLFDAVGMAGVIREKESGDGLFTQGCVTPLYHVLAWMSGRERVVGTQSSHPLQIAATTLVNEKKEQRVLLANLLGATQRVRIKTGTCTGRVKTIHDHTVLGAMRYPERFQDKGADVVESASGKLSIELRPYAIACVDVETTA